MHFPSKKNESYVRLWCRLILISNWKNCFGKCPDIIFQPAMFDEIHIFYACEDSLLVKDTSDKAHSKALEHFAGKGHAAILRF